MYLKIPILCLLICIINKCDILNLESHKVSYLQSDHAVQLYKQYSHLTKTNNININWCFCFSDVEVQKQFSLNQSRVEDITMKEDLVNINLGQEDFGKYPKRSDGLSIFFLWQSVVQKFWVV